MNQKAITAVLFSAIVAFAVASWGRILEWWVDMSPFWKAAMFTTTWAIAITVGYSFGPVYALCGIIAGLLALLLLLFVAARELFSK